ncbi:TonB-dependent receptor [Rhizorhabdus histidinilytica]|uniref:Outer membrane receptor proteins, mostly Fe transport n=1 Tax=Rhizorhabdus histidinilytica TaxID=439228 RepID=A0A1T5FP85_9SPHN|nr:TonB-dependent receptor [Rhizorhabdus histidinilytica]SKB97922.1 Outer membrane receptor proteins, mostly Fe transport [Rhizorhabdus histidinilytica]
MNMAYVKAVVLATTALSAGAYAQDVPVAEVAAGADDAEAAGPADIIVTARKRAENLRDVPVAITAITGDMLVRQNITQVIDLSKTTPNFTYSYGAANTYAYIRGFGSGSSAGFEQSVGKFVDNVSYGRDQEARIPIFDVERVEVLKGPQVLTFGNSATAGVINIATKKPGDTFQADGSIGYEFYGQELQGQMGVTVPLMDGASFRLAGLFQDLDRGRYRNPIKGKREPQTRNYAVRPTLRLTPADGLDIVLKAEVARVKDIGGTLVPVGQPLVGARPPYPVAGDDKNRYIDYNVAPFFSDEIQQLDAELYQADINYDVLGGTFTSTTAWRNSDSLVQWGLDGVNHATTYFNPQWTHFRQFSQELRFGGTFGDLDATVGAYYQRDTLAIDVAQEFTLAGLGFTGAAATPFARVFTYDQKNRAWSGFVDLTYHLTDRLSLSGGVRYTNQKKSAGQSAFAADIIPNTTFDTRRARLLAARNPALDPIYAAVLGGTQHNFAPGSLRLSEDHWQPQAIVQYEVAPRNKAYVKYVKGDKVGGFDYAFTGADPALAGFRPESAWMVEAGLKGLLFGGKLDYSIAAFRETFSDLQQSAVSGLTFIVTNVGKARSQGIELEWHFRPDEHWTFGFSGSYLDAKYINFPGGPCNSLQNANLAPGCAGTPRAQDFSGVPTQYASKWTGSFSADYLTPVGSGEHQVGVGVTIFARTKYDSSLYNDPRMVQHAYADLGAHVDFGAVDGRWNLSLFGRNLTDQRLLEYGSVVPGSGTAVTGSYSRGRQLGVKLSFNM